MKKIRLFICAFVAVCCCMPQLSAQKYLNTPLPEAWTADSLLSVVSPADDSWWKTFGDTCLTALIDEAVDNNYDLLAAAKRIQVAKSMYNSALAGYSPVISAGADWVNNQTSGNLAPTSADPTLARYLQADLSVSWEIDLFGKVYFRAKESKEEYNATKEEYNAAMIALCSQLATNYITLRTYQTQMQVAERHLLSQKAILSITETRFNTGLASALDVAQAKSIYYATAAKVPELETTVSECLNAIGILSGKIPWMLDAELNISTFSAIPASSTQMIPVSVPAEILRQRPDVRAAEKSIDACASLVGATVADWLPKFYVTGKIGVASQDFKNLFQEDKLYWQVAPAIKWNIFSGTALSGQIQEAKAKTEMAVNAYNNVVLNALQEVDNSMVSYKHSISEKDAYAVAYEQAELTFNLALDLYKKGLIEFQNVLDAQRNLLSYEEAKVMSEANVSLSLVQLYLALGGGY